MFLQPSDLTYIVNAFGPLSGRGVHRAEVLPRRACVGLGPRDRLPDPVAIALDRP